MDNLSNMENSNAVRIEGWAEPKRVLNKIAIS